MSKVTQKCIRQLPEKRCEEEKNLDPGQERVAVFRRRSTPLKKVFALESIMKVTVSGMTG